MKFPSESSYLNLRLLITIALFQLNLENNVLRFATQGINDNSVVESRDANMECGWRLVRKPFQSLGIKVSKWTLALYKMCTITGTQLLFQRVPWVLRHTTFLKWQQEAIGAQQPYVTRKALSIFQLDLFAS